MGYIHLVPTIHRQNGFDVMIYTADHEPMHVHIRAAGNVLVVNLGVGDEAPTVRENRGMKRNEARRAVAIVKEHRDQFIAEWKQIHG